MLFTTTAIHASRNWTRSSETHTSSSQSASNNCRGCEKGKQARARDGGEKESKENSPPQPTHAHSAIDRAPGSKKKTTFYSPSLKISLPRAKRICKENSQHKCEPISSLFFCFIILNKYSPDSSQKLFFFSFCNYFPTPWWNIQFQSSWRQVNTVDNSHTHNVLSQSPLHFATEANIFQHNFYCFYYAEYHPPECFALLFICCGILFSPTIPPSVLHSSQGLSSSERPEAPHRAHKTANSSWKLEYERVELISFHSMMWWRWRKKYQITRHWILCESWNVLIVRLFSAAHASSVCVGAHTHNELNSRATFMMALYWMCVYEN